MKNFTKELKDILTEEAGAPILSPDEVRSRANTMVILTNQAPKELLAIAGPSRQAILLNYKPLMITFPDQKGVYKVQPDDIVFENHHSGRDVTEAGSQETSYEKFFAAAMKKFGVSSPIELSPDETKKFFNYVDKNWKADEESDGSKTEILPALARGAMAVGNVVGALGDENEGGCGGGWEDPPRLGGEPSLITPMEGDDVDEASAKSIEKARRKAASGKETGKREKTQAANVKKRVAGSEKTAAEKDRQKLTAQRKRNQELIAKKTEKEAKRREQEQQSQDREKEQEKKEREREQQQQTRDKIKDYEKDNGDNGRDDDKKDDKKGGFLKGLAGAVKQAADKEKSFVGGK